MPPIPIVVLNSDRARFDCTFGRGCDGVCCREGRPPIDPHSAERIDAAFPEILDWLRPEARQIVEQDGYLSEVYRHGQPVLREAGGWCIFFNDGCALHKVGESRGSKFGYKPYLCALFPLEQIEGGDWYVRQKGYRGEAWDFPCLSPGPEIPPAVETIQDEIALASFLSQWE